MLVCPRCGVVGDAGETYEVVCKRCRGADKGEAAMENDSRYEVGKFYKTRGGGKARIYATDGGGYYLIHGAIWNGGVWTASSWTSEGAYHSEGLFSSRDILGPWIGPPVVDWDKFPKHIIAVAGDSTGDWWAYTAIPKPRDKSFSLFNVTHVPESHIRYMTIAVLPEDRPEFSGAWWDSLAVRPGTLRGK